jgi:hypothetical protein
MERLAPRLIRNFTGLTFQLARFFLQLKFVQPAPENGEFHGVIRFYHKDQGEKVATKCIRVSSTATTQDVIETLREKFRSDMRMLSQPRDTKSIQH